MTVLTSRFVETVTGKPGRRVEYQDDRMPGLFLRVTENGAKSWAVRYTRDGKQARHTLGRAPALSLDAARTAAQLALGAVAAGRDPAAEKRAARSERKAIGQGAAKPLETVADLWARFRAARLAGNRRNTIAQRTWLYETHIKPRLGATRLDELDAPMIRNELLEIAAPVVANRVFSLLRTMLGLAVELGGLSVNPLAGARMLHEEQSRERVLSDAELRALWPTLHPALRFALLTLARIGDVTALDASEIDQEARAWVIPAERFKTKRAHVVPLSPAAWQILEDAFAGNWGGRAFPMTRQHATRLMRLTVKAGKLTRATPHDLRRTGATLLASERVGVPPHVVAAALGHRQDGPANTKIYLRHRYDAEKRDALTRWADALGAIVSASDRARAAAR